MQQNKKISILDESIKRITAQSSNYFYGMYKDQDRNRFYSEIIEKNVKNKVVLEIGAGAGLLSCLCIKNSAKHVYALEANEKNYNFAKETIKRNGFENKITLLNISSTEFKDEKFLEEVDVVLHELIADNIFGEAILSILFDIKKRLKKSVIFLPEALQILVTPIEMKESIFPDQEIEGIKLADWKPLKNNFFTSHEDCLLDSTIAPLILEQFKFSEDFSLQKSYILSDEQIKLNTQVAICFRLSHKDLSISNMPGVATYLGNHWKMYIALPRDTKRLKISYSIGDLSTN